MFLLEETERYRGSSLVLRLQWTHLQALTIIIVFLYDSTLILHVVHIYMYYIISTCVNCDALLPHMHAQGLKQSVLSVVCLLSVCLPVCRQH